MGDRKSLIDFVTGGVIADGIAGFQRLFDGFGRVRAIA